MDIKILISLSIGGVIIAYVSLVILYMKLGGGNFMNKLKNIFKKDNQQLTNLFLFKKYLFLITILFLNVAFSWLVYAVSSYRIIMYLMLFLKSKDVITTIIWLISLIIGIKDLVIKPTPIIIENKNIVSVITVYSETYEQIIRTLDSIVNNEIGNNKNLLYIITDGKNINLENTMTIVHEEAYQYQSWKQVDNSINMIYGTYKNVPCIIAKKKLNQGKKDSLILSHDLFNYARDTFVSIQLRDNVRSKIRELYGLDQFNYMFCTDADSIITNNSFMNLIETMERRNAHACCGLVVVDFVDSQWSVWNLYQNFQYLYGQYVRRGCENLIGKITCMPGCITMFRIHEQAANAIKLYSTLPPKNDFIKNSVQMLGTDRRLAASFLYQSSNIKHVMDYRAKCYTIPPKTLYQYISQRRRWGSNMYFNTICNMIGPNINCLIRFLCFLDIIRVSLGYFRIFNTALFIFTIVSHPKHDIISYIPFIVIIIFPINTFFIYSAFDKFLRKMCIKIIIGYFLNKTFSLFVMIMIISNMFWNVGSTAWGGVQHKSTPSTEKSTDVIIPVTETAETAEEVHEDQQQSTDVIIPVEEVNEVQEVQEIQENQIVQEVQENQQSNLPIEKSNDVVIPVVEGSPQINTIKQKHNHVYRNYVEILRHKPIDLRTTHICKKAVRQNGYVLKYVPNTIKNQHLCTTAVRHCGEALQFVPNEFKTEHLCRIALRNNGGALQYVPTELKSIQLCKQAVKQSGSAFFAIPSELKTKKLSYMAVRRCGIALYNVPNQFITPKMCVIAVTNNRLALHAVPEKWITQEIIDIYNRPDIIQKVNIKNVIS